MKIKTDRSKYFFSIGLSILGLSLHVILIPQYKLLPFILAYPMIYAISALWGLIPALISIFIWTSALSFLHFEPRYSFHVLDIVELIHLSIFSIGAVFISWLVDVTRKNQKRQSELILQSYLDEAKSKSRNMELEQINKLKDQFVNTLSHDLRNPLLIVSLSIDMILKKSENKELVTLFAGKALVSLGRIESMLQDLLDSRRISAGNPLHMKMAKFNLMELLNSIREDFVVTNGDRLIMRMTKNVDVYWSEKYIRRAVENLLNNAIKYGFDHTPVEMGITLQEDKTIDLWVKNQGIPISKKNISQMFESFSRVGHQKTDQEGWGIGLTLVKSIVEGHGGVINVISEQGTGTCFHLVLPQRAKEI